MLDGKAGSVMAFLDEECRTPGGGEAAYVRKMHERFSSSKVYSKPLRGAQAQGAQLDDGKYDELQFVVTHYAGDVRYTAVDWLEKNRGTLAANLRRVMTTTACPLVAALFPPDPFDSVGGEEKAASKVSASSSCASLLVTRGSHAHHPLLLPRVR